MSGAEKERGRVKRSLASLVDAVRTPFFYDEEERFTRGLPEDSPERVMDRLRARKPFFTSEQYMRQMTRADYRNVRPDVAGFGAALVLELRKREIPVFVVEAWRDFERQEQLVREGRSKARPPEAPHCKGCALDIVHSRFAWDLTRSEWAYIGRVGKDVARKRGIRITWGGDWRFYDPAHWELQHWRTEPPVQPVAGPPINATPHHILRYWSKV